MVMLFFHFSRFLFYVCICAILLTCNLFSFDANVIWHPLIFQVAINLTLFSHFLQYLNQATESTNKNYFSCYCFASSDSIEIKKRTYCTLVEEKEQYEENLRQFLECI